MIFNPSISKIKQLQQRHHLLIIKIKSTLIKYLIKLIVKCLQENNQKRERIKIQKAIVKKLKVNRGIDKHNHNLIKKLCNNFLNQINTYKNNKH